MPTQIHKPKSRRLAASLIAAWQEIPAAVAADALAGRGHVDPSIRPLRPFGSPPRLVGSAITAWCMPTDYGPVHHAIAVAEAGDVIVIAAGGRSDAAMIGELLSGAARRKGIAGVVVDGAVRDAGTLASWPDFAVFSRHVTPRGPSSMELGSVNETVVFGGISVSPHDIVIGDDDGIVVMPHGLARELLAPCQARVAAEVGWQARLAEGKSTIEVFKIPAAVQAS